MPDGRYDDYQRSPGFIKEYIFPGLCIPSLTRLTSAMAASSRLWYVLKSSRDHHAACKIILCNFFTCLESHQMLNDLQCGACGKHRSTLLSNTQTLEEKLNAKPKVKKKIILLSTGVHSHSRLR